MALVPYRVSGPAADQTVEERLFQVGGHTIRIQQIPQASGALRPDVAPGCSAARIEWPQDDEGTAGSEGKGLENVGFVVWQVGFVVTDLLMRHPPWGGHSWAGIHAVDLGTGTGLVGIALALAGAQVVLTDMEHILPLTRNNAEANCSDGRAAHMPRIAQCRWGSKEDAAALVSEHLGGQQPDLITAADVLYEERYYDPLLCSLKMLSAPHTISYVGYKRRNADEERFIPMAEACGFCVEAVPLDMLSEEYQDGTYAVLRLCLLEASNMALD